MTRKKLPIGIQTFREMRHEDIGAVISVTQTPASQVGMPSIRSALT
ncbi:hypothetical protein FACS189475_10070 [Betaproteobacteria bacterium]|nr:hypothetical protein FACS189475_10070 [Betaproteobacteria bacterium]